MGDRSMSDEVEEKAGHDSTPAPGGQLARDQGCCCSVLANAAFRMGVEDEVPIIDPRCQMHLYSAGNS